MMGKVNKKLFYFYYFWIHQPYAPAMHKNQNQKYVVRARRFFYGAQWISNAAETYNIFFHVFSVGQNMENDVCKFMKDFV